MSWAARLAILLAFFVAGGATGIKWQLGQQARIELAAAELRASDARQQRLLGDQAATAHAAALANVNQKLGNAREHIAKLSGRECLGAGPGGTVGVLNAIGGESVPAAASEPAGAPGAAAPGAGVRFATERDVASAIAVCRAGYAGLSSQLNQILDIEAGRSAQN
jgi:hypothetical protein